MGDITFAPLMIGWTHEALKLETTSTSSRPRRLAPARSCRISIGDVDMVSEVKWLPELDVTNRLQGDFV